MLANSSAQATGAASETPDDSPQRRLRARGQETLDKVPWRSEGLRTQSWGDEMEQLFSRSRRALRPAIALALLAFLAPMPAEAATQVGGHNDPGQDADAQNQATPGNASGAIGPTRFIQAVNSRFAIYNRNTDALIAEETLNILFNQPSNASSYDAQILWDNQTKRFYYLGVSVAAAGGNFLAFGWSKTANPPNGSSEWCHYTLSYGARLPDGLALGDSRYFIIFGFNVFDPSFAGAEVVAVGKPASGPACPDQSTLSMGVRSDIRDPENPGQPTFVPVPANDIETRPLGFYVASDIAVLGPSSSSTKIYVGAVSRNPGPGPGTGDPVFEDPKIVTVASYRRPPDATQLGDTRKLMTLDGRFMNAQMAKNPDRAANYSLWTSHTIRHPTEARSVVRWYELNPASAAPTVMRTGTMGLNGTGVFYFNSAISPDRRADGAIRQFGDSFVLTYNTSRGGVGGFNPRINVVSSFNGGPLSAPRVVRSSPGPYVDFSCGGSTTSCRWWGAAATPDPKPPAGDRGAVWGTNQVAGPNPATNSASWDTFFFAHRP